MRYYGKIHSKLPIFRVKSVKIYTGQKNLHGYARGARDKYQVCTTYLLQNTNHLVSLVNHLLFYHHSVSRTISNQLISIQPDNLALVSIPNLHLVQIQLGPVSFIVSFTEAFKLVVFRVFRGTPVPVF